MRANNAMPVILYTPLVYSLVVEYTTFAIELSVGFSRCEVTLQY